MIHEIAGAFRDLNAKGRGPETFRKVWRGGEWVWISGYLPQGTFLASDRRAQTKGPVETGEIIVEFGRRVGYGGSRQCVLEGFYRIEDDPADVKQPYRLAILEARRNTLSTYFLVRDGMVPVEVSDPLRR